MTDNTEQSRTKLVDEFSAVMSEAEDMLKRAANETGDKAKDLRSQVEAKLLTAKLRLQELRGPGARPRQGQPRARPTTTCTSIRGRRSAWPRRWAWSSAC